MHTPCRLFPRLAGAALIGLAFALPATAQDFSIPAPNVDAPAPNVSNAPTNDARPRKPRRPHGGGAPRTQVAPGAPPFGTDAWRRWCATKHPTFDPSSGLYTDRTGFRRPCS